MAMNYGIDPNWWLKAVTGMAGQRKLRGFRSVSPTGEPMGDTEVGSDVTNPFQPRPMQQFFQEEPTLGRELSMFDWVKRAAQQRQLNQLHQGRLGLEAQEFAMQSPEEEEPYSRRRRSLSGYPMPPDELGQWGGSRSYLHSWEAPAVASLRATGRIRATPGTQLSGGLGLPVNKMFGLRSENFPGYQTGLWEPGDILAPGYAWTETPGLTREYAAVPRGFEGLVSDYPRQNIISLDIKGKNMEQMRQEVMRTAFPSPEHMVQLYGPTRERIGLPARAPRDPYEQAEEWINFLGYQGQYAPTGVGNTVGAMTQPIKPRGPLTAEESFDIVAAAQSEKGK